MLDALAVQVRDARGVLRLRLSELGDAVELLRAEAALGRPLSVTRARVRLAAVEEAYLVVRAREAAERAAAGAAVGVAL